LCTCQTPGQPYVDSSNQRPPGFRLGVHRCAAVPPRKPWNNLAYGWQKVAASLARQIKGRNSASFPRSEQLRLRMAAARTHAGRKQKGRPPEWETP